MEEQIPKWRRVVLTLALLGFCAEFLHVVDEHYPIEHWLFWRYLRCWAWASAMVLGSLGVGDWMLRRLVGRVRGLHAHLFCAFCLGLLVFGLLTFAVGMLHLLGTVFFWALPVAMLAAATPSLLVMRRELWPRIQRHAPIRLRGLFAIAIVVFGMYAFLLIYAGVLTPHNISFDARWKHVAIAESFAADGGIFRFDQGWMFASRPHFASYLYTWAFCMPGAHLFDKVVMCAHIEFVIFAMTTFVGIPALVRRLVPNASPVLVWTARFVFPGVFLYDSSLSIGADHIAAVFAIPIFLVTHDFLARGMTVRWGVLLGLMTAGILLTKETAAAVTIPMAGVVVLVGAVIEARRARTRQGPFLQRHRWILGILAIGITGIVVTTPLWLKNILWFNDPFYPNFYKYFTPDPWQSDSQYLYEWGFLDFQFALWHPPGRNMFLESLKILTNWSFVPHDWPAFHGNRPVIGSLLTLLLPCLLLLRGTRRLWILAIWIHVGILMWFWVLPQDRYLQVLMPWMAAWTAAVLIRLWRIRMRLVTGILVAAQVVWGGDVYFLDHNMLPHLVTLFSASRKEQWEQRLRNQAHFQAIGEHLPKGARLIVHEVHPHLGTGVPTYDDYQTYQFGLAYGLMKSPRELWQKFRDMGITHLFWKDQQSQSWDTVAGDIMFLDMALRHGKNPKKFTSAYDTWVAELPAEPPEDEAEFDDTVAVMGCDGRGYASGLYEVRDLHVPIFGPRRKEFPAPRTPLAPGDNALSLARQAAYVVLDPSCNQGAARKLPADFSLAARRRIVRKVANVGYHIYMRLPHDERPPPRKASSRARARPKPDADDR